MKTRTVLSLFVVCAMQLASGPAQASFPGAPGNIVYMRDGHMYVMDRDGGGQVMVSSGSDRPFQGGADWSPDGTQIAFHARPAPSVTTSELYVMDADGANQRLIPTGLEEVTDPTWSPDGQSLAFAGRTHRGADNWLYVVTLATGAVRQVIADGSEPEWSPDGSKIAFKSDDRSEVRVVNPDGSGDSLVAVGARDPHWRPDGSWISFDHGAGVWMARPDGTGAVELVSNGRGGDWSPSNDELVFYRSVAVCPSLGSYCPFHYEISRSHVSGGAEKGLTYGTEPDWQTCPQAGACPGPDMSQEDYWGTAGHDFHNAGGGADRLDGRAGSDDLTGGPGRDELLGGLGDDLLRGDDCSLPGTAGEADIVRGEDGDDRLFGCGGDDTLAGGSGSNDLYGGYGDDALHGPNPLTEWEPGLPGEEIFGESGNDRLHGSSAGDTLDGGEGDDELEGNGGDDLSIGGFGQDSILGGDGRDTLDGGADADSIVGGPDLDSFAPSTGDDRVDAFDRPGQGFGLAENIRCGEGADVAVPNGRDVVSPDCEDVELGGALVLRARPQLRRKSATFEIPCPVEDATACDARVSLRTARKASSPGVFAGSARVRVRNGSTADLPVPIARRARRQLRRTRSVRVSVTWGYRGDGDPSIAGGYTILLRLPR